MKGVEIGNIKRRQVREKEKRGRKNKPGRRERDRKKRKTREKGQCNRQWI